MSTNNYPTITYMYCINMTFYNFRKRQKYNIKALLGNYFSLYDLN